MKIKQVSPGNTYYDSFHVRVDNYPRNHLTWHYHEELELIHIYRGSGTLFIGDCILDFEAGSTMLIGPNLPHYWMFNELPETDTMECIVIHFRMDFAGAYFFQMPEMNGIYRLLEESKRGLYVHPKNVSNLYKYFSATLKATGPVKIIRFLTLLTSFQQCSNQQLVGNSYATLNHVNDEKRMNQIMNYLQSHFRSNIAIDELANETQLTKNSFCRYFKQKTGKTPVQFIAEMRINHACRLLKDTHLTLKEICFESGFNNFVHFHKTFKTLVQITPNQYRKNKGIKI